MRALAGAAMGLSIGAFIAGLAGVLDRVLPDRVVNALDRFLGGDGDAA